METKTIGAEEFIKTLVGDEFDLNKYNYIVNESVDFDSKLAISYHEIRNVTFNGLLSINGFTVDYGLFFENCTFKRGVMFLTFESTSFDFDINVDNCSVLFSNCKASKIEFDEGCKLDRGILIKDKCVIDELILKNTFVKHNSIRIQDSEINGLFDISNVRSKLTVSSCILNDDLRIESLFGDFSILKTNVKGDVQAWNCECPNSFTLNHNVFEDFFKIEGCRFKSISIIGDEFQRKFTLENRDTSPPNVEAYLKNLYIAEANFIEVGIINGLGNDIDSIKIPITPRLSGTLRISNWKVKELSINGINQNLKLLLSQLSIQLLKMIEFTNYTDVTFERCSAENQKFISDLTPNSGIISVHTDLGPAKFIEFDFNSFNFITIDNSSFNDIYTSNVDWFDDSKLNISNAKSKELECKKRREIYRQLKQSLKKQGNQIDSLVFQAREMKAYNAELESSKQKGVGDQLIMLVSKTNNYGINWLKPVGIIIGITLVFYLLIVPLISEKLMYAFSFSKADTISTLAELWGRKEVFFQLFNPARRFSIVYGQATSDWLYLWDALHRIVLGIFIFQIIRAFRKFFLK